jgi:hypothetical protein
MEREVEQSENAVIFEINQNFLDSFNEHAFYTGEDGNIEPGWRLKSSDLEEGIVILEENLSPSALQRGEHPKEKKISFEEYRRVNFPGSNSLIEYFYTRIESPGDRFPDLEPSVIRVRPGKSDHLSEILKEFAQGDLRPMYRYLEDRLKQEEKIHSRIRKEMKREDEELTRLERYHERSAPVLEKMRQSRFNINRIAEEMARQSRILFELEEMVKNLGKEMEKRGQTAE